MGTHVSPKRHLASSWSVMTGLRPLLCLLVHVMAAPAVKATTVEPMTLEELSDHAAQVIDGVISTIECEWSGSPQQIVSRVTLVNVEYLKGAPATADETFVLTVPGGRIGDWGMRVAGAPEFEPGQRWLLFLLPEYRVFPTVGIWQGAFRVVDQNGLRVLDAGGRPVTGMVREAGGAKPQAGRESQAEASDRCVGAQGVRLAAPETEAAPAVSYAEFVRELSIILAGSRKHSPGARAGRAEPAAFTPTSLKPVLASPASAGQADSQAPRSSHLEKP